MPPRHVSMHPPKRKQICCVGGLVISGLVDTEEKKKKKKKRREFPKKHTSKLTRLVPCPDRKPQHTL